MKEGQDLFSTYVVNIVCNVVLSCAAVILNIITCHTIRTSSLSKPLKTLLLSMIVSDLGVGLLVQITRLSMALEGKKYAKQSNLPHRVHGAYLYVESILSCLVPWCNDPECRQILGHSSSYLIPGTCDSQACC